MVGPELVKNGLGCDCICRGCRLPLIAKQGKINEWHFAHASDAECSSGVESAIHQMAKQMIMDRMQVYVPEYFFCRNIRGVTWARELTSHVQESCLVDLRDCHEEMKVETKKPDISAIMPDGQPIAIEVAFTHFCDQEKIKWIKERNLSTLEIDIFIPPDTPTSEVLAILEERLFKSAVNSNWLHHTGAARALAVLDEQERTWREYHAKADAEHEAQEAAVKAKRKRKEEFVASIRDIEKETYRLDRDLTLRIAYSKIRVTMKGHGYFKNVAPHAKQMILDAASHFGGRFNTQYKVWEFTPPENRVVTLYNDLGQFIRSRLEKKPDFEPAPNSEPTPEPPQIAKRYSLTKSEEDIFEERAAIMESEGGVSREEAERCAYVEITRRRWQSVNH